MYQVYANTYQKKILSVNRKRAARIGLGLLVYIIASSLAHTGAAIAIAHFTNLAVQLPYAAILLPSVFGYLVGMPLFYAIIASVPKQTPKRRKLGLGQWIAFLAVSILMLNLGSYIASWLIGIFESLRGTEITNVVSKDIDQTAPIINFITAVIFAPIMEELLCRKLIIDRLLPYSEWVAALTSALFFAMMHGNFYQFFYAALLGFLFAIVYIKTGNLLHTILMHSIINFIGAIVASALSNQPESAFSISPWMLLTLLYITALYGLAVCGVFFLAHYLRHGKLEKSGPLALPLGKQFSCVWLNWGTLLLVIFCGTLFAYSLFI